jgi:hypothetical protein
VPETVKAESCPLPMLQCCHVSDLSDFRDACCNARTLAGFSDSWWVFYFWGDICILRYLLLIVLIIDVSLPYLYFFKRPTRGEADKDWCLVGRISFRIFGGKFFLAAVNKKNSNQKSPQKRETEISSDFCKFSNKIVHVFAVF